MIRHRGDVNVPGKESNRLRASCVQEWCWVTAGDRKCLLGE